MKAYLFFTVFASLALMCLSESSDPKEGDAKAESLENIFTTNHLPKLLPPLGLSPRELKVFAGHSLQLLKAKCPAIPDDTISQLNKYVGKLISKDIDVSPAESKESYKSLIESMGTCEKTQVSEEDKFKRRLAYFRDAFIPISGIDGFYKASPEDTVDNKADKVEAKEPKEVDTDKESVVVDGRQDAASSPDSLDVAPSAPGSIPTVYYSDEGSSGWTQTPVNWFRQAYQMVRRLFSNMFGYDNMDTHVSFIRVRRDTDKQDSQPQGQTATSSLGKADDDASDETADTGALVQLNGKEAFLMLVDNLCRVYCAECNSAQILNFKSASKELLQLVFSDKSGIELAAKHYLTPEFFKIVRAC